MSRKRKRRSAKRIVLTDTKYKSDIILKLMNSIMYDGKKTIAEKIVYDALDKLQSKSKEEPIKIFNTAINNIKPTIEVRSRRVGGATYQVPVDVRPERRTTLAIRWLIQAARGRNDKTMSERVAGEIIDAFNNQGGAMRRKDEQARMAEANRAFAHFRW